MAFVRLSKKQAIDVKWSEHLIASSLARQTFNRKSIVLVPNCSWTGHECDLLVVEKNLKIIDVEVKISKADFKADAKKEKWWDRKFTGYGPKIERFDKTGRLMMVSQDAVYNSSERGWPKKVWKHYFAMPEDVWSNDLVEFLPSKNCGVIVLSENTKAGNLIATVVRRAVPNKDAYKLTPEDTINVARLANLRLWDAYEARDRLRAERKNSEMLDKMIKGTSNANR